jgi:hypothetical protein
MLWTPALLALFSASAEVLGTTLVPLGAWLEQSARLEAPRGKFRYRLRRIRRAKTARIMYTWYTKLVHNTSVL